MDVMDRFSWDPEWRIDLRPPFAATIVAIASMLCMIAAWVPLVAALRLALVSDVLLLRYWATVSQSNRDCLHATALSDAVDAWLRAGCPDGDPVTVGLGLLSRTRNDLAPTRASP